AALLAAIREAREKALARSLLLRQEAPQKEIDAFLAEEGETFIMAQIDLLVALARQKITAGDGEGGKTLARKAGEYALKTKKIHHLSRIGDLAELWIEQGDRAEAALHWKIFEKAAAILAPNDELKPVLLCRAACLAVRAGHQDAARTLVRSAEELIPKIFLLYIPEALVAIAEARLALQEPEKAASMMTSALKAASAHTHERARALGAFRVCLFADENGLSLTAADKQTLKLLLRL
ncbi:MAG: hypothetical protein JNG86_05100, partial [Verrucomicrobiaceae bacterium]|nr:hypothetical protein [Verrucomicrobiaceae bacterium]